MALILYTVGIQEVLDEGLRGCPCSSRGSLSPVQIRGSITMINVLKLSSLQGPE